MVVNNTTPSRSWCFQREFVFLLLSFSTLVLCATLTNANDFGNSSSTNCIDELTSIWDDGMQTVTDLTDNDDWSIATSIQVSQLGITDGPDLRLLIAGDYLTDNTDKSNGKSYLQGLDLNPNNMKEKPTLNWTVQWDWDQKQSPLDKLTFRSFTRVLAHPTLDLAFVSGRNLLRAYSASKGTLRWSLRDDDIIKCCHNHSINNGTEYIKDEVIYDSMLVMPGLEEYLIAGGTCNQSQSIVIDIYSVNDGSLIRRNNFTIYRILPRLTSKLNQGKIPPETCLSSPNDASVYTEDHRDFFYMGINHGSFTGVARFNIEPSEGFPVFVEWTGDTFINPSYYSHRSVVSDFSNGMISLLDPKFLDVLQGGGKHLIKYELEKLGIVYTEHRKWEEWVWYGGHTKHDFKMDWSLASHGMSDASKTYVISWPRPSYSSPFNHSDSDNDEVDSSSSASSTVVSSQGSSSSQSTYEQLMMFDSSSSDSGLGGSWSSGWDLSYVSQHNSKNGELIAGAKLPFGMTDGIVSSDGKVLFVSGYTLTPIDDESWKSKIKDTTFFYRNAVFMAVDTNGVTNNNNDNNANDDDDTQQCFGCKVNYYGNECENECDCRVGFCNDDIDGDGECYCSFDTYGEYCEPCKCNLIDGICNNGANGDGFCKLCYWLDLKDKEIRWPNTYGKLCNKRSHCNITEGLSDPRGENGTDGCIWCFNDTSYGRYCNMTCQHCSHDEYCDNGPRGQGCVKKDKEDYDYGGITFRGQFWIYSIMVVTLFLTFFFSTWIMAIQAEDKVLPMLPDNLLGASENGSRVGIN